MHEAGGDDGPQRWLSSLWLSHMTCQTPLDEPLNSSAWNKVIELVHLSKTTNKQKNTSAGRLISNEHYRKAILEMKTECNAMSHHNYFNFHTLIMKQQLIDST